MANDSAKAPSKHGLKVLGVLYAAVPTTYASIELIAQVLEEAPEYVRDIIHDLFVDDRAEPMPASRNHVRITPEGRKIFVLTPKGFDPLQFMPLAP